MILSQLLFWLHFLLVLNPTFYLFISLLSLIVPLLQTVMFSPSLRDKPTFQSELRKRDSEFHTISQENFDLKLKVHQLERQIQTKAENRRDSATPPPDNFYDFNDEDNVTQQNKVSTFDDNDPIIRMLRGEVSDLRTENDDLMEKNDHLNDALDELREQTVSEMEKGEKKLNMQHAEMQMLVNQEENLQSENLRWRIQVGQANEMMEGTRKELEKEKEKGKARERRKVAAIARAEGLSMQFKATIEALEDAQRKADVATRKMGATHIQYVAAAKELAAKGAAMERLQVALRTSKDETGVLKEALHREKERAGIWKEAGLLVDKGDRLFAGDGALHDLVSILRKQHGKYEAIEYEPTWREIVMRDLNDCLRVLYRSQREIEAKRQVVIDTFSAPRLHQNPPAPVL